MLNESDLIALRGDQPEHRLRVGDTGTVVSTHPATRAYTVEFMTLGGETPALLTLPESELRPVAADEIAQARPPAAAVWGRTQGGKTRGLLLRGGPGLERPA